MGRRCRRSWKWKFWWRRRRLFQNTFTVPSAASKYTVIVKPVDQPQEVQAETQSVTGTSVSISANGGAGGAIGYRWYGYHNKWRQWWPLKEAILVAAGGAGGTTSAGGVGGTGQEMQVVLRHRRGHRRWQWWCWRHRNTAERSVVGQIPSGGMAVPMVVQSKWEPEGTLPLLIPVA